MIIVINMLELMFSNHFSRLGLSQRFDLRPLAGIFLLSLCATPAFAQQIVYLSSTDDYGSTDEHVAGSLRRELVVEAVPRYSMGSQLTELRLHDLQAAAAPGQAVIELERALPLNIPVTIAADPDLPRPIIRSKDSNHRLFEIGNVEGIIELSHLELRDGTIDEDPFEGGAVHYSQSDGNKGLHLRVIGCHFIDNLAGRLVSGTDLDATAGAIYFKGMGSAPAPPTLTIHNSYFFNNRSRKVGATSRTNASVVFLERALLDVAESIFEFNSGNGASSNDAGVFGVFGSLEGSLIRDSLFFGNTSMGGGAATVLKISGVGNSKVGWLTIQRCNFVSNGEGAPGGPVIVGGTNNFLVENSIFTRNEGTTTSVYFGTNGDRVTFRHSTITNNKQTATFVGGSAPAAIRKIGELGAVTIERSIIAGNTTGPEALPGDIALNPGAVLVSNGHNFIGSMRSELIDPLQGSDQRPAVLGDVLEAPLGDFATYGEGDVFIMPPIPGSTLAGAIPLDIDGGPYEPEFDIRGVSRRENGSRADIGAVQLRRTSYNDWAAGTDLPAGETASPDNDFSGDGLTNRMAYFLGLDPTEFSPNPLTRTPVDGGARIEFTALGAAFTDPAADEGISSWQLETSTNLEDWVLLPELPTVSLVNLSSLDYVRYRFDVSEVGFDRRFYRLRVE